MNGRGRIRTSCIFNILLISVATASGQAHVLNPLDLGYHMYLHRLRGMHLHRGSLVSVYCQRPCIRVHSTFYMYITYLQFLHPQSTNVQPNKYYLRHGVVVLRRPSIASCVRWTVHIWYVPFWPLLNLITSFGPLLHKILEIKSPFYSVGRNNSNE